MKSTIGRKILIVGIFRSIYFKNKSSYPNSHGECFYVFICNILISNFLTSKHSIDTILILYLYSV